MNGVPMRRTIVLLSLSLVLLATASTSSAQTPVKTWISQLGSSFPEERRTAELNLGRLPASSLAGPMTDALGHDNWEVRVAAMKWLVRIGQKDASPAIAKLLKDPVWSVRKQAAEALGDLGNSDVAKDLKEAIKDENVPVRTAAQLALIKVSADRDPELIKASLADKQKEIRRAALYSLYRAKNLEAYSPILVKMLGDEDLDMAGRAAGFLGKIGDAHAVEPLMGVLRRSNDYSFRYQVTDALVRLRGRAMAPTLIELLQDTNSNSRGTVLDALARLMPTEGAETIAGVLTDPSPSVRHRGCMILASMGDAKAVSALSKIVTDDTDPEVRRSAAYALGRIGDAKALDALVTLLTADNYPSRTTTGRPTPAVPGVIPMGDADIFETRKNEAREQALTAIAVIGGEKAAEAIFLATTHKEPRVRGRAIELLAELGDKRAFDLAIQGLSDKNFFVTRGALHTCEYFNDDRLAEPLIVLAKSDRNGKFPLNEAMLGGGGASMGHYPESALRADALKLLKDKFPKQALPVLIDRLKDTDELVAIRAAEYLGELGDPSAVPALLDRLKNSKDNYPQQAAGEVLCKMKVKEAFKPCLDMVQQRYAYALPIAMGPLAQESFTDVLQAELKDPKGRHLAALKVMACVAKPAMVDEILPCLEEKNAAVRSAAVLALGRPGCEKACRHCSNCSPRRRASTTIRRPRRLSSLWERSATDLPSPRCWRPWESAGQNPSLPTRLPRPSGRSAMSRRRRP